MHFLHKILSIKNEYRNGYKRKKVSFCGLNISFKVGKLASLTNLADTIHILIEISGGLGDFLIAANYIYNFANYIRNNTTANLHLDVIAAEHRFNNLKAVLQEKTFIQNLFKKNEFKKEFDYDLEATLHTYLLVDKFNQDKVKNLCPKLHSLVAHYQEFLEKYKFKNFGHLNAYNIALANNKKRLQLADINDILRIEENFNYPLPYPDNEEDILNKFNLKDKIFITLNRGVDKSNTAHESTKMWQYEKYNQLTKRLKETYPEIVLVQLGASVELCKQIENIDINLIGQTDLEDIKVLIKKSFLHIDSEGGFAHLRNALKAKNPAIVIFGPTNPDFYGYNTNINIRNNDACPIHCDWVIRDWQHCCLRGENIPPCTNLITVEEVYSKIDKYLKDRGELNA